MTYAIGVASAPPKEPKQTVSVSLPVSLHDRLRLVAYDTRRPKSDLIAEAVAQYIDAVERKEAEGAQR